MDLLQISRPIKTQQTAIPQGCSTGDKYIRPVELANKILLYLTGNPTYGISDAL
jgi:hypothetical protein